MCRKATENSFGRATYRVIFGASVAKCIRVLASPSCTKRKIIVACPVVNGCKVDQRSFRDRELRPDTFVIRRLDSSPSGFEYASAVRGLLGRCGVPYVSNISAHTIMGGLHRDKAVHNMLASSVNSERELVSIVGSFHRVSLINDIATGRAGMCNRRGANTRVTLVSFKAGQGVVGGLIGEGYVMAICPSFASTSRVVGASPSNVVLSGNPNSPSRYISVVGRVGGLCSCNVPAFTVYLNRRLVTLTGNNRAREVGCNRENTGRPIGFLGRSEACLSSRGRNCVMGNGKLPSGTRVGYMGMGSGAIRKVICRKGPIFAIRFRPRTGTNPHSATFLFSEFLGVTTRNECSS